MSEHQPTDVWQERPGEFSYRCSCGMHMKHQRFGTWQGCADDPRSQWSQWYRNAAVIPPKRGGGSMITVTLHGAVEHMAAVGLLLIILGAPVAAYFAGRDTGRWDAERARWDDEVNSDRLYGLLPTMPPDVHHPEAMNLHPHKDHRAHYIPGLFVWDAGAAKCVPYVNGSRGVF